MKRIASLLAAAVLAAGLCACQSRETEEPPAETAPAAEAAAPALAPGAAEDSRLSGSFQTADDGTVYTSAVRGEGVACLYDLLPEGIGCAAGFFMTEDGVYAAVKDSYYTLEPAALYFFPSGGGEARLLAESVSPAGLFCLAGDGLFYESYGEENLWRLDVATGESRCVLAESVNLLGADGGFIYYARDGGIYRNDSTMTSETLLFADGGVGRLWAGSDGLCLLTYDGTGASVVEIRGLDGSLRAQARLDEYTDSILVRDGIIYAPQTEAKTVLMLDYDGNELGSVPLTEAGSYCLFYFAGAEGLYYETTVDEAAGIYCLDPETGETRRVGDMLIM